MAERNLKQVNPEVREIIQRLEKLRLEQEQYFSELDTSDAEDAKVKADFIKKNIRMIDLGVDEGRLMFSIADHMYCIEAEMQKLQDLAIKLDAENTFLSAEVKYTLDKLIASEQEVTKLEEEKKQLEFEKSLMKDQLKSYKTDSIQIFKELNDELTNSTDDTRISSTDSAAPMVREATAGCDLSIRHLTLCNLVTDYVNKGRYDVAVPLCKQAIDDLERISGHYHPDVANILNILALVYREKGDYRQSEILLEDALDIREKIFGKQHKYVATTINNLAVLYGKQGKYTKAEELSRRSLRLQEQALGEDHPDLIKHLKSLGMLYFKHDNYNEAVKCFHRALEICRVKRLPDDNNIIQIKVNLAHCYLKQQRITDARMLYKQVVTKGLEHQQDEREGISVPKSCKIDDFTFKVALKQLTTLDRQQGRSLYVENFKKITNRLRSGTMNCSSPPRVNNLKNNNMLEEHRRYSISSPNKTEFNQIRQNRVIKTPSPSLFQTSPNRLSSFEEEKEQSTNNTGKPSLKKKISYLLGIDFQRKK